MFKIWPGLGDLSDLCFRSGIMIRNVNRKFSSMWFLCEWCMKTGLWEIIHRACNLNFLESQDSFCQLQPIDAQFHMVFNQIKHPE